MLDITRREPICIQPARVWGVAPEHAAGKLLRHSMRKCLFSIPMQTVNEIKCAAEDGVGVSHGSDWKRRTLRLPKFKRQSSFN